MINPSPQLFEYKLSEDLHFELKRSINIQLPFSDQPIDYTFNNLNYTELASDNLKYNFEIKHMRTAGDYLVVSYRPSKSLEYQDISEAPHSSDYLLAVINIKEGKMKVFSLNFQETVYLGCTSKGDVFLYDVGNSEKEGVTKVHIVNVKEALNNNHPA
jgi:hypothetical protein